MKIENRENVKGKIKTTVFFKNERYVRLQKDKYTGLDLQPVVEWRKCKTNHLVKAEKHKLLEEKFKTVDTITKITKNYAETNNGPARLVASGSTSFYNFIKSGEKTHKEKRDDEKMINFCNENHKLAAVRYYKEISGLGLKESKDYVDALYANHLAGKKWDNNMDLTRTNEQKEQKAIAEVNKFFKSNSQRKQFVSESKRYFKETGPLQTVKLIKDTTGCGLYEAKIFFDNCIK